VAWVYIGLTTGEDRVAFAGVVMTLINLRNFFRALGRLAEKDQNKDADK